MNGIVVKYDPERGFGFIRVPGQENDVFVHASDVKDGGALGVGMKASFSIELTEKGPRARNVTLKGMGKSPAEVFLGLAACLVLFIMSAVPIHYDLSWLTGYVIAINAVTLAFYGYDKRISGRRATRVPEFVLHLLALLGGTPAALLGQKLFHHKTAKPSFQIVFWSIAALQLLALLFFYYWN